QILTSLSAPIDLSSIEASPMIFHHQEFLTHFSTSTVKTTWLFALDTHFVHLSFHSTFTRNEAKNIYQTGFFQQILSILRKKVVRISLINNDLRTKKINHQTD
ncbi:MAG TPA: hypothetical protein DCE71_02275, partial [Parachlamydiales bacterium]|nr:hypothetical protein [Parachlamydiales bacterium]